MNLKRILSIFLAVMIIVSGLPISEISVFAADGDPQIEQVIVTKTYRNLNDIEVMYIEVKGTNLGKLGRNPVIVRDGKGNPKALSTIVENDYRLYYKIDDPIGVTKLSVNEKDYNLGVQMPSISGIEPLNRMVSNKEELIINGSGFKDSNITVNFYSRSGLDNTKLTIDSNKITKGFLETGVGGTYRVEFIYEDTANKLIIEDNYPNLFTVYGELGVSDDITMTPNQGLAGTTEVKIKGKELTKEMSVFFLEEIDGSDLYRVDNRGTFVSYGKDVEEDSTGKLTIDVFTVRVPAKLEQGRYYVVLTNNVNNESNFEGKITSTKTFANNIFTVIDGNNVISIEDVTPSEGPETGVDARIDGRYIGTLSQSVFIPNEKSKFEVQPIISSSNTLEVYYRSENGSDVIGKYKLIGGEQGVDVLEIKREIVVYIGGKATFREGSSFSNSMDKINIRVPSISLKEGEDPAKSVTVEVKTTITYLDGKVTTTEIATWEGKFTFEPINYKPKITIIVPSEIPVNANNEISDSFKISIVGENFLKYRYVNEAGETKVKQPVINLGNQLILDPNITTVIDGNPKRVPVTDMKIFNKNGVEIDGTTGNDIGVKILVTVPKGYPIDPAILNVFSTLTVTNPIKNNEDITADNPDKHLGLSGEGEIRFIKISSNKTPIITKVTPSTITTAGEKGIVIEGQNFSEKFTLYMDGEKITSAKRNGTGTQITFDAPAKPEGYVQLIVQNDDGALAVYDDFLYVKTYTDPKIVDFNPKKGTAFTLVDLKGQNLVPPNPLVKDLDGVGFMKLIGTRVFLGGEDINTYATGNSLIKYETPVDNPILKAEGNKVVPSDYYHSIILEDESNNSYYKIYFDTKSGKYFLTDGDKDVYEITAEKSELYARKGGYAQVKMTISQTQIELDNKTLTIKTPYAVEKVDGVDIITGNRVKVLNENELYFEVPPRPREGYYDIAIVNPDTKKDERKGNAGFWYFFQPGEEPPRIDKIEPAEGSIDGQYNITITGENFVDRGGDHKTSVTIGGVVVPAQDIIVSPDGKSMTVKVPKYPGDLSKETDMDRKYVNVIVLNPSGGSDKKINGFAYIIPVSHPKITRLILNKGSAAGGEIVTIEGSDFRYFEPYRDANNNGAWEKEEEFTDKNNNGKWDDFRKGIPEDFKEKWEELVEPVLPTVYFGDKIAKIKSFTASTIDVEVPKGTKGTVQVYLVNNDRGVSNRLSYTYEASNPRISSVTPGVGKKQGGDNPEIIGEGFAESTVLIYDELNSLPKEQKIVQVQFAKPSDNNMTNANLPLDDPNSGRIRDKIAQAKAGQLELKYDASGNVIKLNITLTEKDTKYVGENITYNNDEVFLPLNLLKNDKDEPYKGNELVRIKLEKIEGANSTYRIRLDRGFAPSTELINSRQVSVITPSYYTIGDVQVQLINPDGGIAKSSFKYTNPDSKPKITNITKDGNNPQLGKINNEDMLVHQVSYRGGNILSIIGEDFRENAIIQIGDILTFTPNQIEYELPNRLRVTMPALNENAVGRLYRVTVVNEDGASASSDKLDPPIYIQIIKGESNPTLESITPSYGPVKGGTEVIITGNDFRKEMDGYDDKKLTVFFGEVEVPEDDIEYIDYKTIKVITPPNLPGRAAVKVVNPDGEIAQPIGVFTYLSSPTISTIVDPLDETTRIDTISVEGGEIIKIKGTSFASGARVVFAPVLRKAEDSEINSANALNIGGEWWILESGTDGTEVNIIDSDKLTVKTPQGKEGTKGVIVINPDKGASPIYQDLVYGLPQLKPPTRVDAELVYDRYIRVHWTPVSGARGYELYVVINDRQTDFIGNTDLTSFVYQDLEPNTRYRFVVKTIGEYGLSIASDESNTVRTGRVVGPPDTDGGLTENTTTTKTGDTVNIVIGSKDYNKKDLVIDLTKLEYAGTNKTIITISAEIVAANDTKNITITAADYSLVFNPKAFAHSNVVSNKDKKDAGVRFTIENNKNDTKTGTQVAFSNQYLLYADFYVGKSNTKIENLKSNISFTLDYDRTKADLRRITEVYLGRYDDYNTTWESLVTEKRSFNNSIKANINKLGRYTIFGKRG